jgi:NTE family protein
MTDTTMTTTAPMGLILTGGGARAAYQVGGLQEVMALRSQLVPSDTRNPFKVICGTSSGAINASVLACGADRFDKTLERLVAVWRDFKVPQVYRSDILEMLRSGASWLSLLTLGWMVRNKRIRPKSLLDNSPLSFLLHKNVDFGRLPRLMAEGHLSALAITASNYTSGEHVTFYQSSQAVKPWVRNQRVAMPCELNHDHLLASSAIPFVFPAAQLMGPNGEAWFGDGAMRQTAPISPAIHLGAEKILVIGVGRMHEPAKPIQETNAEYPSMARIAGHALASIFLDSVSVDVERVQRINQALRLIAPEQRKDSHLRPIDLLVIAPSERLDDIALRHAQDLPGTVQKMLSILGQSSKISTHGGGGAFMSYLLFDSAYTQELIELGRRDARAKATEIRELFGW